MICPRCGYEMKEEHLYCERCGAEIQIVPDFEPEIQNSIEETLSTVAEEINRTRQKFLLIPERNRQRRISLRKEVFSVGLLQGSAFSLPHLPPF